ncbi:hypothetical protein BML2526_35400 [Providencia rettgeri]|nr:hypothetical protein BML2526_35400 [Providencia rettgeri]BBV04859.1 hypothetical protein BML2531_26350 [Providencia rettgeri]BBV12978.1 hypothetical protein BML2576_24370 [Providencia rettgeri]BDH19082.1 hypothetical protein PrNR1418_23730 [Providencia rettgeri]
MVKVVTTLNFLAKAGWLKKMTATKANILVSKGADNRDTFFFIKVDPDIIGLAFFNIQLLRFITIIFYILIDNDYQYQL